MKHQIYGSLILPYDLNLYFYSMCSIIGYKQKLKFSYVTDKGTEQDEK